MAFDCAQAPALLGHPGAEVVACGPFYGSPTLRFVWLSTRAGAVKRFVLRTPGEALFVGEGLAAAGRFLEEGRLNHNVTLDQGAAQLFLQVAGARPPGWTALDGGGNFPRVGRGVAFSADPFVLTLIRAVVVTLPSSLSPALHMGDALGLSGGRPPAPPRLYERAVLARSEAGVWEWALSAGRAGEWAEQRRVALR